jgi:hypothetical protein
MNNEFDELTKSLAQSVTRRGALKKFGLGLAGMALACFGLASKADAATGGCRPIGRYCGRGLNPEGCKQCCSTGFRCDLSKPSYCYCA